MTPSLWERWQRTWCRLFGHRVVRDARGAPVADFTLCVRCGRWWR